MDAAAALPSPPAGDPAAAQDWVRRHLGDLAGDDPAASPRFRGGQGAADAALAAFDVAGYASGRNEVWPAPRRGASGLSPYIRHGLLPLPRLWAAVSGPARDVAKYRDELLWQEYARHLYARLGRALEEPLRAEPPPPAGSDPERAWDRSMACVDLTLGELERDGWLVNQTRMWLASQWSVRHGLDWRDGAERFYVNLLDGSRAANGAGWQWAVGTATGKPYGFSRWQVEKRAPGLCGTCVHQRACPIERWPDGADTAASRTPPPLLGADPDPGATGGPAGPQVGDGEPAAVWLTAESLGDDDPALAAHPDLPAVFVFDAPLLTKLGLSGKRLVFLAETLGDLAARREVRVARGDPVEVLRGVPLAATWTPVPGWRRRAAQLAPVAVHPWPWLARPHGGSMASYSAWIRQARPLGERAPTRVGTRRPRRR